MGYSLKIDHELKIVRYTHTGKMSLEEIGDAWREMLGMEEFTAKGYNILTDYRDGYFDFSIEQMDRIDEFLLKIKDILKGKKNAVLTYRPNDVAISLLVVSKKQKEIQYHVEAFTTEEDALRFLSA